MILFVDFSKITDEELSQKIVETVERLSKVQAFALRNQLLNYKEALLEEQSKRISEKKNQQIQKKRDYQKETTSGVVIDTESNLSIHKK